LWDSNLKKRAKQREAEGTAEGKRQLYDQLSLNEIKELALAKPGSEEEIEFKRREAYIERPTQKLLRSLLERGKKAEILPTYDPSSSFRYETVESVFDENVPPAKAKEFLERLCHLEILRKGFFDTVSACPVCGSTCITLHYRCPGCTSRHIVKTGLTEHIPCGNIDERDKYVQGHRMPTCPKCGTRLVEGEYRDMGLWYVCKECGEKFEHPHLDVTCRKCDNKFKVETGIIREISKYALNPDREQEIRQNVTSLESIYKLLTELDFNVEMPASATGEKSGIQHKFSLIAKKKFEGRENIIAIDHAVGDVEVGVSPLILYIYKISEVRVDLPIFVAIPKLCETAKRIAHGYNILVIEGIPKEKERLATLNDEIQRRLSERTMIAEAEVVHQWIFRRGKKVDVWRNDRGKFVKGEQYRSQTSLQKVLLTQGLSNPQPHAEHEPKKTPLMERIKKAIKGNSNHREKR
jgi:DNA-directed RNA polymerase subunit RPC12/RpoP